eukprot:9049613-Pyramimonas_sp.AAC.1
MPPRADGRRDRDMKCRFCGLTQAQLPPKTRLHSHEPMCSQMSFELWRALNLRRCVLAHSPEEVASWPLHCAQCGAPFKSSNSRR